jgi:tetratricopeptide (TPR) repeat protein
MELTNLDLELLEAYSDNKLTTDQVAKLQAKLARDIDFRKEAKDFLETIAILKKGRKQNVQAYLQGIEQRLVPVLVARPQQRWVKMAAVAATLILVSALAWQFMSKPATETETTALLSEFVQPYAAIGILKDDSAPTPRVLAMTAYANADYNGTIQAFEKLPQTEQTPMDIFYLAYANLEIKNYDKAKTLYTSIIDNRAAPITATLYYLALCHVAQQNKSEAIQILSKIKDDDSNFGIKAKVLLDRLK